MAGNKYLLAVIGIITNEDLNEPVFLYDKTEYQLIYDCDIQVLIKGLGEMHLFIKFQTKQKLLNFCRCTKTERISIGEDDTG